MSKRLEFELYDQLTPQQRIHLQDFQYINAIRSASEKKFTEEEQNRLFVVIDYVCSENSTETSNITVADEIVKAYTDGDVTLDTLEKAKATEILDAAIGIGSFESLEEEVDEEEEEIE
ncbi:MAG: hypothetical protein HFJ53_03170 [Clostridia bacterium]|jgi:hypothetical protein|nr:hypothetical protein [Clostridia bacterium]